MSSTEHAGVITLSNEWNLRGTANYTTFVSGIDFNAATSMGGEDSHAYRGLAIATDESTLALPGTLAPVLIDMNPLNEINAKASRLSTRAVLDRKDTSKVSIQWQYNVSVDSFLLKQAFGVRAQTIFLSCEFAMFSDYNKPTGDPGVRVLGFRIGSDIIYPIYKYVTRNIDLYHPADYPLTLRAYMLFEITLKKLLDNLLGRITIVCAQQSDASNYTIGGWCRMTLFSKTITLAIKQVEGVLEEDVLNVPGAGETARNSSDDDEFVLVP